MMGKLVTFSDPVATIYVIPLEVGSPQRITPQPSAKHTFPGWSPDCNQIVFVMDHAGNEDIYMMQADGTDLQRLTMDPARDTAPTWSPDGTQIAFESDRGQVRMIYVMHADGSEQTVLTDRYGATWSPAWSPDGNQLAFIAETGIHIIGRDGRHERLVTTFPPGAPSPAAPARGLDWSPDGQQLVFSSQRDYVENLYAVNIDGTNLRQLTAPRRGLVDTYPVWSPDGVYIAFVSNRGGDVRLWVMPADGGEPTVFHNELFNYGAFDWCM